MTSLLDVTGDLPEVTLAPGEVLIAEGGEAGGIWILVSGALRVTKNGVEVNTATHPGVTFGEMSLLLGRTYTATVEATEPTVLRYAADGMALLDRADVTRFVATALAERLAFVTSYLVDLKHQYGDAPGLAMIPDVLRELSQRQRPKAQPGSMRDPDPEY